MPADQATPGIKAHMAEVILEAAAEGGQIHQAKCLSTPPNFATGVLDGVHKAKLDLITSRVL